MEFELGGDTELADTIQLIGLKGIGLTDFKEVEKAPKFLKNKLRLQERRGHSADRVQEGQERHEQSQSSLLQAPLVPNLRTEVLQEWLLPRITTLVPQSSCGSGGSRSQFPPRGPPRRSGAEM